MLPDPALVDGALERVAHVGRDRSAVASPADHLPAPLQILRGRELPHVLGADPARIAVELVLAQLVSCDEVHLSAGLSEAQRSLRRRDAPPDDRDPIAPRLRSQDEARLEDVLYTTSSSVQRPRPVGPAGLPTRPQGQEHPLRVEPSPRREIDDRSIVSERDAHGPIPHVQIGQAVSIDHVVAVLGEQRHRGARVRRGEQLLGSPAAGVGLGKLQQRPGTDVELVDRGRAQVAHAGVRGAPAPGAEQPRAWIEEAEPIALDAGLGEEPDREVDAMDPAADDEPVQLLTHGVRPRARACVARDRPGATRPRGDATHAGGRSTRQAPIGPPADRSAQAPGLLQGARQRHQDARRSGRRPGPPAWQASGSTRTDLCRSARGSPERGRQPPLAQTPRAAGGARGDRGALQAARSQASSRSWVLRVSVRIRPATLKQFGCFRYSLAIMIQPHALPSTTSPRDARSPTARSRLLRSGPRATTGATVSPR